MLPTSFGNLEGERPALEPALSFLSRWFASKPTRPYVDIRELSAARSSLSTFQISEALEALVSKKILKVSFRVIAPTTRTLTADDYQSIEDIPTVLQDNRDDPFETSNAQITQVYRGAT